MKRKRSKNEPNYTFMDVELCFTIDTNTYREEIKEEMFRAAIILSLKALHGEVGKAIPFDILYYDESLRRAYIRIATKNRMKFWSALTLFSSFLQKECVFSIHQVEGTVSNLRISSNAIRNLVEEKIESD